MRPRLSAWGAELAERGVRGPVEPLVLRAVQAALPRRFDPERARDLEAVLELRLRPQRGTVRRLGLRIDHGRLTVQPGGAADAGAGAELSTQDLLQLVAGAAGWPELISAGRMTLFGDPFLAMRFPALFHLPAAGQPAPAPPAGAAGSAPTPAQPALR